MKLPHDHFSWSQYDLWTRSKEAYRDKYFRNIEPVVSKGMEFGKTYASQLETEVDTTLIQLRDKERFLEAFLCEIKLVGYLDTSDDEEIVEYKTGEKEWTQKRVDGHEQLDMYAYLWGLNFGVLPRMRLQWKETKITGKDVQFTGRVETFERAFTKEGIDRFEKKLIKTMQDISDDYERFLKENEAKLNKKNIEAYIDISSQIKNLEGQKKVLSELVKKDLESSYLVDYENDTARVYFTSRKSYTFPAEFLAKEELLEKEKKELQKSLPYSETKSITYRLK